AAELLAECDVVMVDQLVNLAILEHVRPEARILDVGKRAGERGTRQDEINELLVAYARQGHVVVRLKGGDPFVFGRGGEEALALAIAGIPFEVVPGVSSAIAVPAYAGIPVTHRDHASTVIMVTGHEGLTHPSAAINWEALAKVGGTLVILMGMTTLPHITRRLLDGGLPPDTQAAVIQQGTVPQQRVVTDTLEK